MDTVREFQRRRGIAKARQAQAVLFVPGFFVGAVALGYGLMQPFAIALCAVCGVGFFAASLWAEGILRCPNCGQRPLSPEVLKDRNGRFEADAVACIHCGARLK
jgi:DNA-directed RNA polymerase subunit RPC12/RpoP